MDSMRRGLPALSPPTGAAASVDIPLSLTRARHGGINKELGLPPDDHPPRWIGIGSKSAGIRSICTSSWVFLLGQFTGLQEKPTADSCPNRGAPLQLDESGHCHFYGVHVTLPDPVSPRRC
jgi:hypothetical protein